MLASPSRSLRSSPSGSPDPLRTLQQEMRRENEREFERSQRSPRRMAFEPQQSPPRGFTTIHEPTTGTRQTTTRDYQNAELRALSESMRSLGGGDSRPSGAQPTASFCAICDSEEQNMSSSQRHTHEHHRAPPPNVSYTPQQPLSRPLYSGYTPQIPLSTWNPQTAAFTPAASPNASIAMSMEESALYSSQPSRAVLSALRSLQDKLQELRVEKAALENRLARDQQTAAEREYELAKKQEKSVADLTTKLAESEASWMARAKESREVEEKLNSRHLKLEAEVRMLKEQAERREADLKSTREEGHKLKLRINDAELALARSQNEQSSTQRDCEATRADVQDREMEVQRLKNEVNRLAESLHQAHQQQQQLRLQVASCEEQRDLVDRSHTETQNTLQRLAADLKVVSKDLLAEREVKQQLLNYKYLTRDYVSSLLNLNYEMSIDAGMSVRKRNDLLQHSHDLLQGLKKQAWALEFEHTTSQQAEKQENQQQQQQQQQFETGDESLFQPSASGSSSQGQQMLRSPSHSAGVLGGSPLRKTMNIGGVPTLIEEQRYLLASASSPEAIRVLHPDVREEEDDSECESEEDGPVRLTTRVRAPTTPTVSTTNKRQPLKRRGSTATKGAQHSHTLTNRGMELPFTVGKSAKQSFSLPVNVQEILAKQPSYYSKVAQKQLAQSRRHASGDHLAGPVEEERIVVYPPPPAESGASLASNPAPISLAAHSNGLQTVIEHLEREVDRLNRDYIHQLDHGRRDGDAEKHQLQKALQAILKQIELKTKHIKQLKQHQEAVQGNHGVRLYSAATAASRASSASSSRAASTKKNGSGVVAASKRPSTGSSSRQGPVASHKKRVSIVTTSSSTDLTDRHAHHQHGTQTTTPRKSRHDVDSETPALGFLSPNAQRVLDHKIKAMRLLGQFKDMFSPEDGDGEAAKRFGSD